MTSPTIINLSVHMVVLQTIALITNSSEAISHLSKPKSSKQALMISLHFYRQRTSAKISHLILILLAVNVTRNYG